VLWLGVTHLQSRFFVLAIPVAALLVAQASGRPVLLTGGAALVLAVIGFATMHARMATWFGEKQIGVALGFEGLSEFMTPQAAKDAPADVTLVLVGDAKAFCYQRPMSRLRYRTIFDVPPGDDWLAAWAGEGLAGGRALILIDPGELSRFGRTYSALQPVPREVLERPEPFLMDAPQR
jgi:hypothetical protein